MANSDWKPPDGGYGWVVVASGFFLQFMMSTMMGVTGVLFAVFVEHFKVTRTQVALITSIQTLTSAFAGLIAGMGVKMVGSKPVAMVCSLIAAISYFSSSFVNNFGIMYITMGFLYGLAPNGLNITAGVSTQQYFNKRKSLASGIMMLGIGIGLFAWPMITQWLVDWLGWRGALVIAAGILLNGMVFGALLRPPPTASVGAMMMMGKPSGGEQPSGMVMVKSILTNLQFGIFCLGTFLAQAGLMMPFLFAILRAREYGIQDSQTVLLVTAKGIPNIIGRLVWGWLGDRKFANTVVLLGLSHVLSGLLTAGSYFLQTFPLLMVYSCLVGCASSGFMSLMFPAIREIVGLGSLGPATGIYTFVVGISISIFIPVGSKISDMAGETNAGFGILGIAQVVGGLIIMSILFLMRRKAHTKEIEVHADDDHPQETT